MTLDELKAILEERPEYHNAVYIHWTAGGYDTTFGDYHLCIDGRGRLIKTKDLFDTPAATWRRNYRSIAIALCCGAGAMLYRDHTDFGDYPPTDAQIECLAQVLATIKGTTGLPLRKSLYMTHAEAAELDEYGPSTTVERWDLWTLPQSQEWGSGGDYIRGKAIYYDKQWNS